MLQILEDNTGTQRALIRIDEEKEGTVSGTIISHTFSTEQVDAFETFMELVNSFALSLLDEAQDRIDSFGFRIRDAEDSIKDLEVHWEVKEITYKK